MKKTTLILGGLLLTLSSCGKGSDSSSKYYSSHSYYSSSSSSSKRSYTATDLVDYLVREGTEDSGAYSIDIVSGGTFYTLFATPDTLSFKLQAVKTAVTDNASGGLIIYNKFTWGSITSGDYEAGLVVYSGTSSAVMPFGIAVKSYYADYEIHEFSYQYSSNYGLSKSDFKELVLETVNIYNTALTKWNSKLESLGYPTIR